MKENKSDYLILWILYKNDRTSELKSYTKKEIADKTNYSLAKVNKTIATFQNFNYVAKGIMDRNAKTYYLTKTGIEKLNEFNIGEFSDVK